MPVVTPCACSRRAPGGRACGRTRLPFGAQQSALQETLEHRGRDHGVQVSTISGTSTYYIHDNNGNLLGERIGTNHYYYLSDGLGSIVAVISGDELTIGDRYGYDPYGNTTTHTGTTANPWGDAGHYTDTTPANSTCNPVQVRRRRQSVGAAKSLTATAMAIGGRRQLRAEFDRGIANVGGP